MLTIIGKYETNLGQYFYYKHVCDFCLISSFKKCYSLLPNLVFSQQN